MIARGSSYVGWELLQSKIAPAWDASEVSLFFADALLGRAQFKHPLFRIKINSIQMRESEQDSEQIAERVFHDRQCVHLAMHGAHTDPQASSHRSPTACPHGAGTKSTRRLCAQ